MKELELLPFGDPFLSNKPSEFDFEKEDARELSLRLFHAMGKQQQVYDTKKRYREKLE